MAPVIRDFLEGRPSTLARVLELDGVRLFPTPAGWAFLACQGAMLAIALVYANNLALLFTLLLTCAAALSLPLTLRAARGLAAAGTFAEPAFAGGRATLVLAARHGLGRPLPAGVVFPGGEHAVADLAPGRATRLELRFPAQQRGLLHTGPGVLLTEFPLGLVRGFVPMPEPAPGLVCPRPLPGGRPAGSDPHPGRQPEHVAAGDDDFRELRDYRPGDRPARIAWPASSRGQGLLAKRFEGEAGPAEVLDFAALAGDAEDRLSRLCALVLAARERGAAFTLRLPGLDLGPGAGPEHAASCLRSLALFPGTGGGRA